MVNSSNLSPALVSPVAGSGAGVHAGEVAVLSTARAVEGGTGVGVGKSSATVCRTEHEVVTRPVEGATAFVHPSHIHVTSDQVAGDLHVTDERAAPGGGEWACLGPGDPVVRVAHKDRLVASEVIPGNIHSPVVRRGRVIVHPTRLSIVAATGVNTKMSPAIWVPWCGRPIPAQ